jgi:ribosomal protein S18 acetylase RimI-like enzyme
MIELRGYNGTNVNEFMGFSEQLTVLLNDLVVYEMSMYDWTEEEIKENQYSHKFVRKTVAKELEDGDSLLITAWDQGLLVGYALLGINLEVINIRNFTVRQEYRRSGIGRMLMSSVLAYAGKQQVDVSVVDRNEDGLKFYKSFGFKQFKKTKCHLILRK